MDVLPGRGGCIASLAINLPKVFKRHAAAGCQEKIATSGGPWRRASLVGGVDSKQQSPQIAQDAVLDPVDDRLPGLQRERRRQLLVTTDHERGCWGERRKVNWASSVISLE